ncbi:Uma2 family endonuclease [Singulisphaera rosea]
MSTLDSAGRRVAQPLIDGQRLDRASFHARYEASPPGIRAELIGGVVLRPSPVGPEHARAHVPLIVWLDHYAEKTPGVEALDNASVALDSLGEPQPDALLRILPEFGGKTRSERHVIAGAPEFVVEVAKSTRFLYLGPKRADYERAGVKEYLVRALEPDELIWHVLLDGQLDPVPPDADGIHRSDVFPGLWLDPGALRAGNREATRKTLDRGLATPEHADFVERLAHFSQVRRDSSDQGKVESV